MVERESTHQPVDIPTFKGEFKEGDAPEAKLNAEVIKEMKIRPFIRKDGGFTKGLTDEQLKTAIALLMDSGVSEADIIHDRALLFQEDGTTRLLKPRRTGTERLQWSETIRVPGMESSEAAAPRKATDTQLLQQTIRQQGEQMSLMKKQNEDLFERVATLDETINSLLKPDAEAKEVDPAGKLTGAPTQPANANKKATAKGKGKD